MEESSSIMKTVVSEQKEKQLNILLPKGSLHAETLEMFQRAGYDVEGYTATDRSYRAKTVNDPQLNIKISRPQEIPTYVAMGGYDLGITGQDWVEETDVEVAEILPLGYGKMDIILAVLEGRTDIDSFEDIINSAERNIRISTEYLNISEKYILEKTEALLGNSVPPAIRTPWKRLNTAGASESNITLILSFGATEGKPPEEADAIIDNSTSSRRTLRANGLKEIERLRVTEATLIAGPESLKDAWKQKKIEEVSQTLEKGLFRRRTESLLGHIR
jgi:ATP phosphoribosyltransferase